MHQGQLSPLAKQVVGRDVQTMNAVNVLWTVASHYPGKTNGVGLTLNHFAPLIPLPAESDCAESGSTAVDDCLQEDSPTVDTEQDNEFEQQSTDNLRENEDDSKCCDEQLIADGQPLT